MDIKLHYAQTMFDLGITLCAKERGEAFHIWIESFTLALRHDAKTVSNFKTVLKERIESVDSGEGALASAELDSIAVVLDTLQQYIKRGEVTRRLRITEKWAVDEMKNAMDRINTKLNEIY